MSRSCCLLLCSLSLLAPPLPAQPPASKDSGPPRTDCHGDPLPPGAVARLGSSRFRQSSVIRALAFSPDSKTLAVSSQGDGSHTLRLLSAATGQEIRRCPAPRYEVSHLVFSADGKVLVGTSGHELHFWDVKTGAKLRDLTVHQNGAAALALSHDGKTVALAVGSFSSKRHDIHLLNADTGKLLHKLVGHEVWPRWLGFSADGKRLASSSPEYRYYLPDGKTIRTIPPVIYFWNVSTGKSVRRVESPSDRTVLSPDHKTLAVRRVRQSPSVVVLQDLESGKELGQCPADLDDRFVFSRDSKLLATGGDREPIRLWDAATGRERQRLENRTGGVELRVFSPDGKRLACVGEWYRDGSLVRIWEVGSGKELRPVDGHSAPLTCVACAPDGSTVATGSQDSTLRVWDANTGKQRHRLAGHKGAVTSVGFAVDGKLLASGGADKTVRLWETATGRELHCLEGHQAPVVSVAFAARDETLFTADRDGLVKRWDIPGGTGARGFGEKWTELRQVVSSPDGKYLVRCGGNSFREPALQVLRVDNGKELWGVRHEQPPEDRPNEGRTGFRLVYWTAAFSPSGRFLASSECTQRQRSGSLSGHVIRLWEVATGKEILKIEGVPHVATALAFSPDGRLLVSAHGNERGSLPYPKSDVFGGAAAPDDVPGLRFWDVATGKEVGQLRGHLSWCSGVVFSPDGRRLVSTGADHTGLVWDVPALRRLQAGGPGKRP